MNKNPIQIALITLALGFAAACTNAPVDADAEALDEILTRNPHDEVALAEVATFNAEQDRLLGALLDVDLDGENIVTFFESEPGVLGVRAKGDEATEIINDTIGMEDFTFSGLFERLRPGAPIPEVIVAAEARAADIDGEADDLGKFEVIDSGINQSQRGLTSSQFLNGGGCPTGGSYNWCLLNWHNGAYAQRYTHKGYFRLAPVSGTVFFRLQINAVTQANYIMPSSENYVHGWWWDAGDHRVCETYPLPLPPFYYTTCHYIPRRAQMRGDVLWASGDTFHFGGRFHDN